MALVPLAAPSRLAPRKPSVTSLRRYAFDEGEQHVDCGSAVVVVHEGSPSEWPSGVPDADDGGFSLAQAKQFLAGGPLTLSWVAPTPGGTGSEQVYVHCWVTIGD